MHLETLVPLPHAAPPDARKTGCSLERNFLECPSLEWDGSPHSAHITRAPSPSTTSPPFPVSPSRTFPPSLLCSCSLFCLPSFPSINPNSLPDPGPGQAQLLHKTSLGNPAQEAWLPGGTAVGLQPLCASLSLFLMPSSFTYSLSLCLISSIVHSLCHACTHSFRLFLSSWHA